MKEAKYLFAAALSSEVVAREVVRCVQLVDLPLAYQPLLTAIAKTVTANGHADLTKVALALNESGMEDPYPLLCSILEGTTVSSCITASDVPLLAEKFRRQRVSRSAAQFLREKDLASARDVLGELDTPLVSDPGVIAEPAIDEFIRTVERNAEQGGIVGYPTGLPSLDEATGGIIPGYMWALGGPTSSGKTTLATQIAMNTVLSGGPAIIFSLEMSRFRTLTRLVGCYLRMSATRIARGRVGPDEILSVRGTLELLATFGLRVYREKVDVDDMVRQCRAAKAADGKLGLVVVDFIQNASLVGYNSVMERLAECVRRLQAMAGELDVGVLVLSQLSNEMVRERGKGIFSYRYVPELAHAADVGLEMVDNADRMPATVTLFLKKQRDGGLGKIELEFQNEYSSFREVRSETDNR